MKTHINPFLLRLVSALAIAVCFMPTSACIVISRVTINEPINEEMVAFIQKDRTTFKDVVDELGTPTRLISTTGGAIAVYEFLDIKYSRANYGWLIQFLPQSQGQSVDMVMAGGGLGIDMFQVAFNDRWIAQYYTFAKHPDASHYVLWPFRTPATGRHHSNCCIPRAPL